MFRSKDLYKKILPAVLLVLAALVALAFKYRADMDDMWRELTGQKQAAGPARAESGDNPDGYNVLAVFDGDTLAVDIGGTTAIVQAVGLNAPEAGNPGSPIECYAAQSAKFAEDLLLGRKVSLKTDANLPAEDIYGRLLRYVTLPDGRLYNKVMLEQGEAYEYSEYPQRPYELRQDFQQAEIAAKAAGAGLWAPGSCGFSGSSPSVPDGATTTAPRASDNDRNNSSANPPARP